MRRPLVRSEQHGTKDSYNKHSPSFNHGSPLQLRWRGVRGEVLFTTFDSTTEHTQMKYPRRLSSGANNIVLALNKTEVAKLFLEDTRSDLGSEAEKMKFANNVNELICRFLRLDIDETLKAEMLVMERIYPIDYRAYEVEKRELWFDVFQDELIGLHRAGFVHRDLKRPSGEGGLQFDNILLTENGLRLIDVGISYLKVQVGETIFSKAVEIEMNELLEFKDYFLNR
ncbi:MAG: hypothetical protein M3Y85_00710 [Bacteroidota bacterium]|nr:hypothetical protein [Bacteroidota bacterium]